MDAIDALDAIEVRTPHMALFMALNNAMFALNYPGDGIGPKAVTLTIENLESQGWVLARREPS